MSIKKRILACIGLALMVCIMVAGVCFAEGEVTTPNVTTALSNGFSSVASDAMGAISAILPIALPILGAVIVVVVGIKIFKKVTGR